MVRQTRGQRRFGRSLCTYSERETREKLGKREKREKGGPSVQVEAIGIDQLASTSREKHEKGEKSGPSVQVEAITTFSNVAISRTRSIIQKFRGSVVLTLTYLVSK